MNRGGLVGKPWANLEGEPWEKRGETWRNRAELFGKHWGDVGEPWGNHGGIVGNRGRLVREMFGEPLDFGSRGLCAELPRKRWASKEPMPCEAKRMREENRRLKSTLQRCGAITRLSALGM